MEKLKASFPDGNWCDMLLERGDDIACGNRDDDIAKVKQLCLDRGIPNRVFEEKGAFDAYAEEIRELNVSYLQASAICMDLPPLLRLERTKALRENYERRFKKCGNEEMLNVQGVGGIFATHEAEQMMALVALAVAAHRNGESFAASIDQVAELFLGNVPKSPYDGSELQYEVLNNGKDFSLAVPEVVAYGVTLPRVEFSGQR